MLLQKQGPSLRPLTTAHLAQTMSLLELNADELRQKLETELGANPALELASTARCPQCQRTLPVRGPCPVCSRPKGLVGDQPIIFVSPRSDFSFNRSRRSRDEMSFDNWTATREDLPTCVLRQIAPDLPQADRPLAAHILTGLDDDGLFRIHPIEVARHHHVPVSRVENLLKLIQRSDPVGVGSPTPQQALLVQLDVLSENRSVPPLAARAIQEGMNLLSRHAYTELGRLLKIPTSEAEQLATFISENLNPYPARAHWGGPHQKATPPHVYRNPDVIITCMVDHPDKPLMVEIVSPYAGLMQVNSLFRAASSQAPADKVEQWQSDLDRATLLVKCLQQRDHTLVRLMRRLVTLQRQFILEGDAHLLPITRARIADELGVHESTISRAVSEKAVQLPNRRIIPLAKLFDRSLHIRTVLREIIDNESKPLSDNQIAAMLKKRGYPVARRTVAKYRSMEGILPARLRQPNMVAPT